MLCAVILSCIYFPWYVRERKKQRAVMIQPSKPWSLQLSLGTVAEMKKMTADTLERPLANDDEEPDVSGEGRQWTLQHPWAPRK